MKIECPQCQAECEASAELNGGNIECCNCHCKFFAQPIYRLDKSEQIAHNIPEIQQGQGNPSSNKTFDDTESPLNKSEDIVQPQKVKYSWWMIVYIIFQIIHLLGWIKKLLDLLNIELMRYPLFLIMRLVESFSLPFNAMLIYAFMAKKRWFRKLLLIYTLFLFITLLGTVNKGTSLVIMTAWTITFWQSKRAKELFVK